jgi:hypothetical protein
MRALVLAGLFLAPFQCASPTPPDRAREDTPGDAIYGLAERFGEQGDEDAERRAMQYLLERYPDSRHCEAARLWLAAHPGSSAPTP